MKNRVREEIFIFGASGHGKVAIDIIERQGLYNIGFLIDDDPALKGCRFFGYGVIGGRRELLERLTNGRKTPGIVAIGNNAARGRVAGWLRENSFCLFSAVHPSALISRGVVVGDGTVIMAGAVVNADTVIGDNVIINTGVRVDHDCIVGNGVHLAPGVILCGGVTVGEGTFICAGATIIPNVTIGSHAVVGAGSTVLHDVPGEGMVVGTPARFVRAL